MIFPQRIVPAQVVKVVALLQSAIVHCEPLLICTATSHISHILPSLTMCKFYYISSLKNMCMWLKLLYMEGRGGPMTGEKKLSGCQIFLFCHPLVQDCKILSSCLMVPYCYYTQHHFPGCGLLRMNFGLMLHLILGVIQILEQVNISRHQQG
jgi:hypothetical protein